MGTPDTVIETLKEWVAAGNPGLITKEEFARLESRVDELIELVTEIEQRLDDDQRSPEPDAE
jgi:hypothetical protein